MKNFFKSLAAVSALIAFTTDANAQASATSTAKATIVTPISITNDLSLEFGNIAVSATVAGTVQLAATAAGTRTPGGGVTLPATTGTFRAAKFTVNGEGAYTYAITLPAAAVELNDGASHTMNLTSFTSTPSGTGALTAGTQVLYVGATLGVAAGQVAGVYNTTTPFTVTVNYN